ncbi:dep domain containing protein 5 [Holotrichia oblita]|uniref:Dep domain containing protein 5 n=1 Tax=Holotrichia oblita TaxID=644536 RepID=A0ACB9T1V0_HOLOL|nr:dep domain containing protein 5 [Holotrichia oblita]
MKLFHLIVHQKTFSEEDLLINPKDYQEAKEGDIVEIFHPSEDDNPRLLLQIKAFKDDLSSKDTISIEQSIAAAFGLRNYKDISMQIVNPADVALDSIELTFKDQYMGRSEMWRLKNSLINTCVYMNKKIEFCGGAVRCQVYEMWSQGDRVACGVITDDTKVVFRSSTSMVYLFLQMSSEMWDFNIYGDLYFEKAVNGFLSDLFMKWKKNGSNHEVTIVLFSRTFYKASSLEEFPLHMRECLQKDYKGRYYEDFYRVAVQNERYEDWSGILVQLRRLFSQYLKIVLEYHTRDGEIIPAATNSTAAQGNFLEVLNMSLNVFEKHYLDRSFDRTGQLSVVITPGVGVFEVDRELTNITKQRIIDNGVGSDLVCVGEQPLHAVPLLKFHNKDTHLNVPDDYSMPHWINLSFYSTNKKVAYSNFIPRIKLPPSLIDNTSERCIQSVKTNLVAEEDYLHNSFFDYDAYDAQVFQIPAVPQVHEVGIHKTTPRYKRGSGGLLDSHELCKPRRKLSDPDIQHPPKTDNTPRSQPIVIPSAAVSPIVSPLNDSPTGVLIQQHHYQAVPAKQYILTDNNTSTISFEQKQNNSSYQAKNASLNALIEYCRKEKPVGHTSGRRRVPLPPRNISKTFLWGATGEQEWTPAITTGVDWKSLTIPACLPITTDYFPDKRALQIDYVVSLYNLLPDDVNAESQQKTNYKKPLTTIEVFQELISQRLAQGFQLILMPSTKQSSTSSVLRKNISDGESTYSLSIGRLFHKITLSGNAITVTRYRPRSGSKVLEKGRASPAIEILQQHLNDAQSQDSGNDDNIISDPLLRPNASSTEILEAMKQPINGLGLLPTHQSLPQYTFISSDAINWLITHMEGVTTTEKAIKIFTTMQRDKLICHASGDITKPFVQGFFLYYIVYQNDKERIQQSCDLTAFQNDWMEVEVKEPLNCSTSNSPSLPTNANTDPEDGVPHFLRDEINPYSQVDEFSESTFRRMLFDIDSTNKSDRVEWGHVRYQTTFRPDQTYELVVEWLVASGSIVSELLHQWARKVQAYGLQMVPIPNDPLALPYSDKSDPLRGPIFVPLNIDCLDPNNILFKEFRGDTYTERLFLLQEAILYRFGFIPCLTEAPSKEATSQEYQYIHCTGTVFILISSPISKSRNKYFSEYHKQPGSKYSHHADIVPSPHEAYITRHVSGKNKNNYDKTRKMGFLWSWNYMISKRWRTNQVDTSFQLKLLKDFREFCSNVDNRLKIFWNESWEIKNNINTKNHFRHE